MSDSIAAPKFPNKVFVVKVNASPNMGNPRGPGGRTPGGRFNF
jgi:hypothetical protein